MHVRISYIMLSVKEDVALIGNLALSCYGPGGRSKVLGASAATPAGVITTISGRLISGLHVPHPFMQMLVQTSATVQQQQHGDGGLLALHLACRLVLAGLEPGINMAQRRAMCEAYQHCLSDITAFLGQQVAYTERTGHNKHSTGSGRAAPACSMQQDCNTEDDRNSGTESDTESSDTSNTGVQHQHDADISGCVPTWRLCFDILGQGAKAYLALARAVLSSKHATGLSPTGREAAILKLVQAHVACLPDAGNNGSQGAVRAPLAPRLLVLPGLQPEQFDVVQGVLLDVHPLSQSVSALLPMGPSLVAVFDVALEPTSDTASTESNAGMQLQAGSHGWSPAVCELDTLVQLLLSLRQQGVRLLACQKGIHKEVAEAAHSLGLVPLSRLSAVHTQQLLAATGALPISSVVPPMTSTSSQWSMYLGVADGVQVKELGTRMVLHVSSGDKSSMLQAAAAVAQQHEQLNVLAPESKQRRQSCITVVLGAPSQTCCDELRAAATATLRVLSTSSRLPLALPGGGATEALLAQHLDHCCRQRRQEGGLSAVQMRSYEVLARALLDAAHNLACSCGYAADLVRAAVQSTADSVTQCMDRCRAPLHVEFRGWLHDEQKYAAVCGWDLAQDKDNQFARLTNAQLLDSLAVKLSAISSGVHAACMLLKVDGMLKDSG